MSNNKKESIENPTIILVDTEFSTLGNDGRTPELISIALTNISGTKEFYKELEQWNPENVSEFTQKEVIPLLWRGKYKSNIKKISKDLKQWLESFDTPVVLGMDSVWDWVWIKSIAESSVKINTHLNSVFETDLPYWANNLSTQWVNLNWDSFENLELMEIVEKTKMEHQRTFFAHHALLDVRSHADICRKVLNKLSLDEKQMKTEDWNELFFKPVHVSLQARFAGLNI